MISSLILDSMYINSVTGAFHSEISKLRNMGTLADDLNFQFGLALAAKRRGTVYPR